MRRVSSGISHWLIWPVGCKLNRPALSSVLLAPLPPKGSPQMNRRLALVVGSLGLVTMLHSESADARGRVRFGGGGVRVQARGSVSVHWSSPVRATFRPRGWSVGGHVYVGGGYYPRYR